MFYYKGTPCHIDYDTEAELWLFAGGAFSFRLKAPFSFFLLYFLLTVFPLLNPTTPILRVLDLQGFFKKNSDALD